MNLKKRKLQDRLVRGSLRGTPRALAVCLDSHMVSSDLLKSGILTTISLRRLPLSIPSALPNLPWCWVVSRWSWHFECLTGQGPEVGLA